MDLISGTLVDGGAALNQLEALVLQSRAQEPLPASVVIAACDALSQNLNAQEHLPLLLTLGFSEIKAQQALEMVRQLFSRDYLTARMALEFGALPEAFFPYGETAPVRQDWKPLGVLLHIAAGNADALPAFSVIEGLLTGNINLLKLPSDDDGLSLLLLQKLVELEPRLAPYLFVFDCPSRDTAAMQRLADTADAIVTWGGDTAVSALRGLASPNTRLIEWGHKLSFAYVSGAAADGELKGIARNICETNQLLCSSCQGIFLDTEDFREVLRFSERFLSILAQTAAEFPETQSPFFTAQKRLELYTEELESLHGRKRVLRAKGCSVIAYEDRVLSPSYQFRNCWVRSLPRNQLLAVLSRYKNRLQTAALVCEKGDRGILESLLAKTGLVRITSGARMSTGYCGQPHDGDFPLRRYMKRMSYEY